MMGCVKPQAISLPTRWVSSSLKAGAIAKAARLTAFNISQVEESRWEPEPPQKKKRSESPAIDSQTSSYSPDKERESFSPELTKTPLTPIPFPENEPTVDEPQTIPFCWSNNKSPEKKAQDKTDNNNLVADVTSQLTPSSTFKLSAGLPSSAQLILTSTAVTLVPTMSTISTATRPTSLCNQVKPTASDSGSPSSSISRVSKKSKAVSDNETIGQCSSDSPFDIDAEVSSVAEQLLRTGGMPLFPPARRDWEKAEATLSPVSGVFSVWPPTNWKTMDPDTRLLVWETASTALALKCGFPLYRQCIMDAFQFLALPGSNDHNTSTTEARLRHTNFTILRKNGARKTNSGI